MSVDICFFDTNVLVYFYTNNELNKKAAVTQIINECTSAHISVQVLNEFSNVMHKKYRAEYEDIATAISKEISVRFEVALITVDVVKKALSLAEKYRYSYYDSLIIASALDCGASIVYSEDMHHDHLVENTLRIINPFTKMG